VIVSDGRYTVAVVGAAGMVGTEMIRTLQHRAFPVRELRALDVASVAGSEIVVDGKTYVCQEATEAAFAGVDIAFFSAGNEASLDLAPKAVRRGAVVIDNSSAWRMDPECPLVVPEVNPDDLRWHRGIIANPNCSTIQMVVVLKPIHDAARIRRVVVSTYQAASGAGRAGVEELLSQCEAA
jgi:aspartate-semialdehyde dehydrogenase